MNICTKYGFDISIISGSYGGHRRPNMDLISELFLVVMVDTDDTQHVTDDDPQKPDNFPQVS